MMHPIDVFKDEINRESYVRALTDDFSSVDITESAGADSLESNNTSASPSDDSNSEFHGATDATGSPGDTGQTDAGGSDK